MDSSFPSLEAGFAAIEASVVALRHDLHRHPEVGFKEFRTQKCIAQSLIEAGVPPHCIKVLNFS